MPITGSSLVSVGWPDSSRAVTAIEAVRLACAVNWKKSTLPWPEIHDPHAPPCGSVAGFLYVDRCGMLLGDFALQHQDVLLGISTRW